MNRYISIPSLSILASLALPALTSQAQGQDKVEIRLRATSKEKPILFVSPRDGNPIRFPGISGELKLDPSTMLMVGTGKAVEPGTGQFNVTRPKGLHANLFGQALVMSPEGMRLSKPFRVFDEDPPIKNPRQRDPNKLLQGGDDKDLGQAEVAIMGTSDNIRFDVWMRPEGSGRDKDGTIGHRAGGDTGGSESSAEMTGLSIKSAATSETFPYRVNCKLVLNFPGTSKTYGGSGVLIDPFHVMTAGHCVYDDSLGGYADSIEVKPAFDNDRSDPTPYGTANWTGSKLIWTGWVTNGQFKHDIAVIRLDRPIGAITSWFGYGYNTSCSFYKSTTFYSGSYPIDGGYGGQDMYWRSGSFDYCPNSRETRFWRLGYGGESGSGYYYNNSGNRYVHGVLSHGTTTVWHGDVTDVVRLNESKFNSVKDYLRDHRPSSADVMPIYVRCNSSVGRGDNLSVTFRVLNYGRSNKNGITYKIYLSKDDYISSSDTLLATVSSSSTINDVSTRDYTKTVTIPSIKSTGTWHIGVVITSSDADSTNNTTRDQEVAQITITK